MGGGTGIYVFLYDICMFAFIKTLSTHLNIMYVLAMFSYLGTGAAPVIAEACLDAGILTVAVVTKPFNFEGRLRTRLCNEGIARLERVTDTLIVVPNQNLFELTDPSTSFVESFRLADDVLLAGVRSITDLMVIPGLINLDFADVQSVMKGMGSAMMGSGYAQGEDRAVKVIITPTSCVHIIHASIRSPLFWFPVCRRPLICFNSLSLSLRLLSSPFVILYWETLVSLQRKEC
jgi:cell division GTPase FtsZ